ncbi:MAG: hypothetical protein CMD69_00900 [Gammaproteobacteria bacterium]|nr:hypothetical protein [Gammaproteobacteria bacterium]
MNGFCHCRKVQFKVETSKEDILQGIYRCDCSLCTKKGIIMKAIPKEDFQLLKGNQFLSTYKWNKNIAEHFFCSICGVYTHHKRRRDPSQFSINISCIQDLELPEAKEIELIKGSEHS